MEKYLKPLLLGKTADRIEDIWQTCYDSSYWKNGPVLNNAISGMDQALWDIKGRQAGMPVYQLGGRQVPRGGGLLHARRRRRLSRTWWRAPSDTSRRDSATCACRWAFPAWPATVRGAGTAAGEGAARKPVFEPAAYMRRALKLFEDCRKELGDEIELLHDMHERVSPNQAVQFCKDVEKFQLFFVEDPLSPEDNAYFRQIRQQCATPIAMGELFNSPHEWQPLIAERLIDYIRVHVIAGGRIHAGAQDRHHGREVRGEDGVARAGGRFAHRPHGQRDARRGELQLRHPGILALSTTARRRFSTAAR